MEETKELLKGIINDLVNPKAKLQDILLKTKVLAYDLHFNRLKDWIEAEINGYQNVTIPKYRVIDAELRGEIVQGNAFSGFIRYHSHPLPIDEFAKRYITDSSLEMYLRKIHLHQSISEIESLSKSDDNTLKRYLPYTISEAFTTLFQASGAGVNKSWLEFSKHSLST